jgi:hypothetical protein
MTIFLSLLINFKAQFHFHNLKYSKVSLNNFNVIIFDLTSLNYADISTKFVNIVLLNCLKNHKNHKNHKNQSYFILCLYL